MMFRFIGFVILIWATLLSPFAMAGDFYTANQDFEVTAAFGKQIGRFTFAPDRTVKLKIAKGQVMALKYDIAAGAFYFDASRGVETKYPDAKVFIPAEQVNQYFGAPTSTNT
ncbi:MAG: hypothetical protein V4692_16185, partial [Bdellovibrionota bacterium]